jgi:hypothetical protein
MICHAAVLFIRFIVYLLRDKFLVHRFLRRRCNRTLGAAQLPPGLADGWAEGPCALAHGGLGQSEKAAKVGSEVGPTSAFCSAAFSQERVGRLAYFPVGQPKTLSRSKTRTVAKMALQGNPMRTSKEYVRRFALSHSSDGENWTPVSSPPFGSSDPETLFRA